MALTDDTSPTRLFVLGTGRSGTTTCAELLSGLPGCRVIHQMQPVLLEEITRYLKGDISHAQMVNLLTTTRAVHLPGGERLSGEVNQRLSFVLPALAEAFPDAKYLWVIRDGRDAVASMHSRQWYHPREAQIRHPDLKQWATNRITADCVGEMTSAGWDGLDSFARCCWYWAYTNRTIEQQARALDLDLRLIRLEQLSEAMPDILAFLGLADLKAPDIPHANRSTASPYARWWRGPTHWSRWTTRQRNTFAEHAGALMDRHYPEWAGQWHSLRSGTVQRLLYHAAKSSCVAACDCSHPLRRRLAPARRAA